MLSLLCLKKNILHTTLLKKMTDIQVLTLPDEDNGSKTEEIELSTFVHMSEIGMQRIFLAPLIFEGQPENALEALSIRYECMRKLIPPGLELYMAAKYMLDNGFRKRMSAGLLTLPGQKVLVEMPNQPVLSGIFYVLYELSLEGYTPIIASPEKYTDMPDSDLYLLKSKRYKFQLNLFSLSGFYGSAVSKRAKMLLGRNFYDYIGTEYHDSIVYIKEIRRLNLNRSQQKELEKLIQNNNQFVI